MVIDLYPLQANNLSWLPYPSTSTLSTIYIQIFPKQKTFLCVYLSSYLTLIYGVNAEKQTKSYLLFHPYV